MPDAREGEDEGPRALERLLRDGRAEAEQGGLLPGRRGGCRAAGEELHGERAVPVAVHVRD